MSRRLLLVALLHSVTACATAPINVPLDRYDASAGYRYQNLSADDNSDGLFVILSFSGGGTRAAAFSFGVMEALHDVRYRAAGGSERRLLQDVDVIASVSGGSFTAAYYALFPDTFFSKFPEEFLHRDIERALIDIRPGQKAEVVVRRQGQEKVLALEPQPLPRFKTVERRHDGRERLAPGAQDRTDVDIDVIGHGASFPLQYLANNRQGATAPPGNRSELATSVSRRIRMISRTMPMTPTAIVAAVARNRPASPIRSVSVPSQTAT